VAFPTSDRRATSAAYTRGVTKLVLDPDKSRVRLHTFAEGLFARLAHDLELECRGISGTAERADTGSGSATLEAPIGGIEVNGTLEKGRVDPRGLSASDRHDVLGKMKKDVFHVDEGVVRVEAKLGSGRASIRVVPPRGPAVERSVSVRVEPEGGATRVSGMLPLSLSSIGSDTVKGPMNAFRVKDTIEVHFDVVFVPSS
jgi:hypothetical protein